ncbi:MAG: hypothetical protein AAFY13_08030 [Pseudomonadota bacterium]
MIAQTSTPPLLLPPMPFWAIALFVGGLCLVLCRVFAGKALLPDIPNSRSSHVAATSRAGGLAIIIAVCSGIVAISFMNTAGVLGETLLEGGEGDHLLDLLALSLIAAGFGLVDDRFGLGPAVKALGQVLPAIFFTLMIAPFTSFPVPGLGAVDLGWFGYPVTVLWIVGFMNVYNFMDGANGLAGACGAILCLMIGLVSAPLGHDAVCAAGLVTGFVLLGFLWVNLGEGRIFMGDGGSQSAAFMIAALGVMLCDREGGGVEVLPVLFVPMMALILIADVALTLLMRLQRGENIFQAHRQHTYQRLLEIGCPHWVVALLYASATAVMASIALLAFSWSPGQQWLVIVATFSGFAAFRLILKIKIRPVSANLGR